MLLKMGSQASHISCLEPQKTESLLYSKIAPKPVPAQVWLSLLVSLFLICRKERHFEISLKGARRNLWSYASGEKYSGVWVRQLRNILITAVIDTEARLCELMNPKGAPFDVSGTVTFRLVQGHVWGRRHLRNSWLWHRPAVIHHLWSESADRWTDNLPKRFLMRSKKKNKKKRAPWWRNGFSGEHAASWTSVFQCRRPSNGFLHCGVD